MADRDDFLSIPAREEGRAPEREEGRGTAPAPVRLGGRGKGLLLSDSSNMFSMLAADRKALEEVERLRTVGRMSLMKGAWLGLEGARSLRGISTTEQLNTTTNCQLILTIISKTRHSHRLAFTERPIGSREIMA